MLRFGKLFAKRTVKEDFFVYLSVCNNLGSAEQTSYYEMLCWETSPKFVDTFQSF
jgi:hypothetical protein